MWWIKHKFLNLQPGNSDEAGTKIISTPLIFLNRDAENLEKSRPHFVFINMKPINLDDLTQQDNHLVEKDLISKPEENGIIDYHATGYNTAGAIDIKFDFLTRFIRIQQ